MQHLQYDTQAKHSFRHDTDRIAAGMPYAQTRCRRRFHSSSSHHTALVLGERMPLCPSRERREQAYKEYLDTIKAQPSQLHAQGHL